MSSFYLSIDLGGTNLRTALLNAEGEILALRHLPSERLRDPEHLAERLIAECEGLKKSHASKTIRGLALGIPGLIDGAKGVVHQSPHFPLWRHIPLKSLVAARFDCPVVMDNDANQAALGEAWLGAGRDWRDFVMITLGTGIGGGIIADGKIYRGPTGFAGEIGHIVIDRHGLAGALGSRGTLESIASQSGLRLQANHWQKTRRDLSPQFQALDTQSESLPEALLALAREGDLSSLALWKDFGEALACGIASLIHTLGIFNFVLGGGLTGAWDFFHPFCLEELRKRSYASTYDSIRLVRARLENNAGLIGGVPLIRQEA